MAGSEALADALKETVDPQNVSFIHAARSAGYYVSPEDLRSVFLKKDHYHAFVELHIEQGPILEKEGWFFSVTFILSVNSNTLRY